ncbi:MAG: S8 family peptidase, partial [Rheinheimera sp.]
MKISLFLIAILSGSCIAAEPIAPPASLSANFGKLPGNGYVLQTTGPSDQTMRWNHQTEQRHLVQLRSSALYPALRQRALLQSQPVQYSAHSAKPQQELRQTMLDLARDGSTVQQLQKNIDTEQQRVTALVQQLAGARVEQKFSQLNNLLLVSGPVSANELAAIPGVVRVWPEQVYQVVLTQSVNRVQAPSVWQQKDHQDRSITGDGVRIAVLDTGIDDTHPALGGCIGVKCKIILGRNTIEGNHDVRDIHGHGTHVAAIAAGKADTGNGVAPDAQLIVVKVLNDQGYGFDSDIIAGIEYAIDPDGDPATDDGADVINMSLGGPGDAQSPISQAAEAAVQAGVTVVVAGGNNYRYLTISAPGVAPSVITVANTDEYDQVHYSSSRGPLENTNYLKPEIAAPGTNIEAAKSGGGLIKLTGTSMAAPHVAGAVALLLQAQPQLSPFEVKRRLMHSADVIHGNPAETGSGRLNVLQAMKQQYYLSETALILGRIPQASSAVFSGSRQLTFFNPTAHAVTVTAKVTQHSEPGLKVSFTQPVQQVPANSQATFELIYSGNSSEIAFPENDAGIAGFHLNFEAGSEMLTLPVTYEKFLGLKVQHDGTLLELRFLDEMMIERFYAAGFTFGVPHTHLVRLQKAAVLKQVAGRLSLRDPKMPTGEYLLGALLKEMPSLTEEDVVLDMRSEQLTEYHKISDVTFSDHPADFSGKKVLSSFAILQQNVPIVPILYSFWMCSDVCINKPSALMTGGFDKDQYSFEQTFHYMNFNAADPESWFFSWQRPLGQGSQTGQINFNAEHLLKFNLLQGKAPVSGSSFSIVWPFIAQLGDVMKVYQTGPLLLPETAPQFQTHIRVFEADSNSGYFSASEQGTILKWRMSDNGPRQLIPAMDFNTKQLPLSSSLRIFTGAVSVSNDRTFIQLSQAPRNNSDRFHTPMLWHDQYLNVAYFNRDTDISINCDVPGGYRWGDHVYGSWFWQGNDCNELTVQADSPEAKLLRHPPTLKFSFSHDGEMPRLANLLLFNRTEISDVVSRI